MLYPQLLGYSINEIYTIKIDTQMMFPTIKINDLVNAVKVDEIRKDGLYVHINFFRGMEMLWINRLFHSPVNASYICKYDHPNYENVEIPFRLGRKHTQLEGIQHHLNRRQDLDLQKIMKKIFELESRSIFASSLFSRASTKLT